MVVSVMLPATPTHQQLVLVPALRATPTLPCRHLRPFTSLRAAAWSSQMTFTTTQTGSISLVSTGDISTVISLPWLYLLISVRSFLNREKMFVVGKSRIGFLFCVAKCALNGEKPGSSILLFRVETKSKRCLLSVRNCAGY